MTSVELRTLGYSLFVPPPPSLLGGATILHYLRLLRIPQFSNVSPSAAKRRMARRERGRSNGPQVVQNHWLDRGKLGRGQHQILLKD